jgi:hypothetical protein
MTNSNPAIAGWTNSGGTDNQLYLMNRNAGTSVANGIMTEFCAWSGYKLTQSDVNQLALARIKNIPLQIQPANLKGYWPMDEVTDAASADLATLFDMSGNGNHGNPDNGANNTGILGSAESILSYPSRSINWQ